MKNLLTFYLAILLPIGLLVWLHLQTGNSIFFTVSLLFYVFVYRSFTDGTRLYEKGLIPKKDIWKTLIKGHHLRYFEQLYLK